MHLAKRVCAIPFVCVMTACGSQASDPMQGVHGRADWVQASESAPVIEGGTMMDKAIWNDPSVLKVGDEYVMYLSSSVDEPFKPPVLPFRAVSADGRNWSLAPEGPLLSAEGTEFVSLETPSVVVFNNEYIMFYSGIYPQGQVPSMAIGRATSKDGITWTHDAEPVLEATGDVLNWNGYLVAEPGAVVHDGAVYLYYTAMGARLDESRTKVSFPEQLQTLGLVISADGKRFSPQKQVLTQGASYPPEQGFVGYSTPAALVVDDRIHLVYDITAFVKGASPEWQQVGLHKASSATGKESFVEDAGPLLTRNDFDWTTGELLSPSLLIEGDTVKMWFAGHVNYDGMGEFIKNGYRGPQFGIGYAEISKAKFLAGTNP